VSVISYIAIAAFLLGVVALIYQIIRKDNKNVFIFLFIGLAGLVLFVVSNWLSEKTQQGGVEEVAVTDQAAAQQAIADAQIVAKQQEEVALVGEDAQAVDAKAADAEADAVVEEEADVVDVEAVAAENEAAPQEQDPSDEPVEVGSVEVAQVAPTPQEPPAPAEAAVKFDDPMAPKVVAGRDIGEAKVNGKLDFNASGSAAKGGAKLESFKWEFGDGNQAEGKRVSHAYKEAGEYEATLTVIDNEGRAAVAKRSINVCRPEGKIRPSDRRSIEDVKNSTSSAPNVSGTISKTFNCSKIYLEISSNIVSTPGCTCKISAQISGPKCATTTSKSLDNGGEGKMKTRASCSGDLGDYTWTLLRTKSGDDCECTWTNTEVVDVFES
jgi:hypothetical protein